VNLAIVYRTLQCYMGGVFVNYYNASAASGRSTSRPRRISAARRGLAQYYVRNRGGQMVPLSAVPRWKTDRAGVHDALQSFPQRADQRACGANGYSSTQATKALEDVFAQTMPREMGFGLHRHVVPGK